MTSKAVQNLVEIRPWEASGQIGEILTIFRFLFTPTQGCAFLASVDIAAHLGDQIAQKPQFCGRE